MTIRPPLGYADLRICATGAVLWPLLIFMLVHLLGVADWTNKNI